MTNNRFFQIAIDGPVGSGKSTVTRLVAQRLGFLYVDTGATYRVAALIGDRAGIDFSSEDQLLSLIKNAKIEMRSPLNKEKDGRLVTVLLDGEDVSWHIRTENISRIVPIVAAMSGVRKFLVELQQSFAQHQSVVMEGRDITYRVLPKAQLKIYLTAEPSERAQRRFEQLQSKGESVTFEGVLADLKKRDDVDMNRAVDPLQVVEGSWVFDTTGISIEEVVEQICQRAKVVMERDGKK